MMQAATEEVHVAKLKPERRKRLEARKRREEPRRMRLQLEWERELREAETARARRNAAREAAAAMIARKMGGDLPKLILLLEAGYDDLWREIALAAHLNMSPSAEWRTAELKRETDEEIAIIGVA
jgi:hypothetical protein